MTVATYTYDKNAVEERKRIQKEYLEFIRGLEDSGELLAVGKVADASVDILLLLNVATPRKRRVCLPRTRTTLPDTSPGSPRTSGQLPPELWPRSE